MIIFGIFWFPSAFSLRWMTAVVVTPNEGSVYTQSRTLGFVRSTRKIFSKSFIDCFRMIMKSYEGYSIRTVKKRYLGSPTNDGRLSLFVPPVMLAETMGNFHDLRGEIKFVNYCSLGKFFLFIFLQLGTPV